MNRYLLRTFAIGAIAGILSIPLGALRWIMPAAHPAGFGSRIR
ncbi:MAG: hypothetical protein ABSC23_07365 [Bryobacteraceae bacterium]